jgi:protein phosphatase
VFGTEVLLLLFSLKVKYPDRIFLLRGNHESESLSRFYGFHRELTSKYTEAVYVQIVNIFSELPLCAVVGDRVFCVHGGISPDLKQISELESLEKPVDFSTPSVFADMVWSDPCSEIEGFEPNVRGCGVCFGGAALSAFLDRNNLDLLVRSHELCEDGIAWPFAGDDKNVERCLTVFSTSDYCERGNSAAILYVAADLLVNVEEFIPLKDTELTKKRVLPCWLCDTIARKEQTRKKRRRQEGASKAPRADENDGRGQ